MGSSSSVVYDTIRVVSQVDSSFMAQIDSLVDNAFGGGVTLALTACVMSAGIVMLGVAIHRAIS